MMAVEGERKQDRKVCPTGVEPVTFGSEGRRPGHITHDRISNSDNASSSVAAPGAADSGDSDLPRLIDAWPTLPDAIHAAMLALLQSVIDTSSDASRSVKANYR